MEVKLYLILGDRMTKTGSFEYFQRLKEILKGLDFREIDRMVTLVWKTYQKGGTIFFCGNGGSASTATHLAADIGKNTVKNPNNKKEKRFKTQALTDNPAWIMALGNDLSYEDIFVEQLKNFAKKGDLLMAISGSGNSMNVVKTVKYANSIGVKTIGLLGFSGGKLGKMVDLPIVVRVDHYGYVEGIHSEIHHYLVEALKELKKSE